MSIRSGFSIKYTVKIPLNVGNIQNRKRMSNCSSIK